jgi:uncharacterized protein
VTDQQADQLFGPTGVEWQRVSAKLALVRRIGLLVVLVPAAAAVVVSGAVGLLAPVAWLPLVVLLLGLAGWGWWITGRVVARLGYAELDEELYVTRGAMFRRMVVVPYGRMQFVDVQAGPLDQMLGIAQVHVHTASPVTGAVIPGLPAEEAARLRDRLTASGSGTSGL